MLIARAAMAAVDAVATSVFSHKNSQEKHVDSRTHTHAEPTFKVFTAPLERVKCLSPVGKLAVANMYAEPSWEAGRRVWTSSANGYEEPVGSRGGGKGLGKGSRGKGQNRQKGRNRGYPIHNLTPGAEVRGQVSSIVPFGVFVNIGAEKDGLLPWARCTLQQHEVEVGQMLETLRVETVDLARQRFSLEGPFEEMDWTTWNPEALWNEDAPYAAPGNWWGQPESESWHTGWQCGQETWDWYSSGELDAYRQLVEELPAVPPEEMSREELTQGIFRFLDVDKEGYLNKPKLFQFAELTGFEGDSVAWGEEYNLMCTEVNCDQNVGLNQNNFESLLADTGGCPCTTEELVSIYRSLSERSAAKLLQLRAGAPTTKREQLKRDAFTCLDKDGNGFLNCEESMVWALATGFDGDDRMWQQQYIELCKIKQNGHKHVKHSQRTNLKNKSVPAAFRLEVCPIAALEQVGYGARDLHCSQRRWVLGFGRSIRGHRLKHCLILVETWDDSNKVSKQVKDQAKALLRKLHNMPPRCSVEGAGEFVFHYTMDNGVCYMALFDKSYPKNLAFCFLEDIHQLFQQELQREFGTGSVDYRSHIETIEKPYFFIKFDRQITKKNAEYRDPKSSKALSKLNNNLQEVSNIMRQNIDEILKRGENLESVGRKANSIKEESKKFRNMTGQLSFQTMLQKYGVFVVIGLMAFLLICFKLFRS
eukprot:s1104_g42.t1